jgi:hypothetical protein
MVHQVTHIIPVFHRVPDVDSHSGNEERAWNVYTNARFGFSFHYPENWRLGNPMQDGIGVTLYPPVDKGERPLIKPSIAD